MAQKGTDLLDVIRERDTDGLITHVNDVQGLLVIERLGSVLGRFVLLCRKAGWRDGEAVIARHAEEVVWVRVLRHLYNYDKGVVDEQLCSAAPLAAHALFTEFAKDGEKGIELLQEHCMDMLEGIREAPEEWFRGWLLLGMFCPDGRFVAFLRQLTPYLPEDRETIMYPHPRSRKHTFLHACLGGPNGPRLCMLQLKVKEYLRILIEWLPERAKHVRNEQNQTPLDLYHAIVGDAEPDPEYVAMLQPYISKNAYA